MALPFMKSASRKKRDQMLAVDLGARSTKAVFLQRRGNGFALTNYTILDTPIFDRMISEELLTEHLKAIALTMQAKGKPVALTVGIEDALVRHVEHIARGDKAVGVEDLRADDVAEALIGARGEAQLLAEGLGVEELALIEIEEYL